MTQNTPSILTIENRERISFTGVESVDAFSENNILLTVNGKRVQITGTNLKVLSFSKGSGNFSASGLVNGIKFSGAKGSVFKRLLK